MQSKNEWIAINDIENNGFAFSFKWIIKPNNNNDNKTKVELSIIVTFRYHQGDKQLFEGLVTWFTKSHNSSVL